MLWRLTWSADGNLDMRPYVDVIEHEEGEGCICGPRARKNVHVDGTTWVHHRLEKTDG